MGQRYDYGPWWTYVFQRLSGLELSALDIGAIPQAKARPGQITLASFGERRDWQRFSDAYGDPSSGAALPNRAAVAPVCRGPITYQGQDDVQRDIADLKAALAAAGQPDGFLNSVAPGSCARFGNEFYADHVAQLTDDRHPDVRHRRPDARGQRGRLLVRGCQRPARARVEGLAGHQAPR